MPGRPSAARRRRTRSPCPLLVGLGRGRAERGRAAVAAGQGARARALAEDCRALAADALALATRAPCAAGWPPTVRRPSVAGRMATVPTWPTDRSSSPAAAASWAGAVLTRLVAAGRPVRALTRSDASAAGARRARAPSRCAATSSTRPRSAPAMAGCEVVYHVAGAQRLLPARPPRAHPGQRRGHPRRWCAPPARPACGGWSTPPRPRPSARRAGTVGHRGARPTAGASSPTTSAPSSRPSGWPSTPPSGAGVELVSVNPASVQGPGRVRGHRAHPDRRPQRPAEAGGRLAACRWWTSTTAPRATCWPRPAGRPGERYLLSGVTLTRDARRVALLGRIVGREERPAPPAAARGDGRWRPASRRVARAAPPAPAGVPRDGAHASCTATPTTARGPPASSASSTRPSRSRCGAPWTGTSRRASSHGSRGLTDGRRGSAGAAGRARP